jgi:predicted Zn-dependent protease
MISRWYILAGAALVANAQPRDTNFYTVEKEVALGRQLDRLMAAQSTALNDPAATAYVDRMVRELGAQIADSPIPFTVRIVRDDRQSSPAVLPGGFIYLPTGLFAAAQSESELAGVLARAMAQVAHRDATRSMTREDMVQMAARPLVTLDGWQGDAIRQGVSMSIPQGMQLFRRQLQMASDETTARMMALSGYDPAAFVEYVSRTGKDDGFAGWQHFQQKLLAALRQAAAALPAPPNRDGTEFARVRALMAK